MLQLSQLCSLAGALFTLALIYRVNIFLGINDVVYVFLTSVVSNTMSLAFSQLPSVVLYTKITPHHIEATVFAMLTGTFSFANTVGGPLLGSFFCTIVGVDSQNLNRYDSLICIQIAAICMTFFYIYLVPQNKDIKELQEAEQKKMEEETQPMVIE